MENANKNPSRRPADLSGTRFGQVIAVTLAGHDAGGRVIWLCRCSCGAEMVKRSGDLTRARFTRCRGCFEMERKASKEARAKRRKEYARRNRAGGRVSEGLGIGGDLEIQRRGVLARAAVVTDWWFAGRPFPAPEGIVHQ